MYGTLSKRDLALELQSQIPVLRPSIHSRRANPTVKFHDLYGFTVGGNGEGSRPTPAREILAPSGEGDPGVRLAMAEAGGKKREK
ncbi:uncharacterized protein J3R85_010738 [Psidium guajava]|nr:uncharacterized protein J3R85_010738 [Psidium guajava]